MYVARHLALALLVSVCLATLASAAPAAPAEPPQPTLPTVAPLADGSYPWISGSPLLWDFAQSIIGDNKAEPLTRERMRELGRLDERGEIKGVPVGGVDTFWVMNLKTNQPMQMRAVLRKIGQHAYLYVQEGSSVTDETVDRLCQQFDEQIYPTNTTYFGQEWKPGIDWDERVTLLFVDIQDGWEPGKGYVGGYFFPLDEFSTRVFATSNEREIVYLDIYPSDPTRKDFLGILAHEFQHMIHFNHDAHETKWINEACSQLAFFVNGYDHAPQIFQFVPASDTAIEVFKNGLDDYGAVYLFLYYLHEKYAGATTADKQAFFRDLCDNQKKGLESVRETLAAHGVTRSLEDLFADWLVANTANVQQPGDGRYGYDDTLKVRVEPTARYALGALPQDKVKGDVQPWAADYLTVVPELRWSPACPTMIDQVVLRGTGEGEVLWTINGGVLPPEKLVPQGSTVDQQAGVVRTPLARQEDGTFTATVGRFVRLGVAVDQLDVRFHCGAETSQLYTIPVFTIDSLARGSVKATSGARGVKLLFDGENKKALRLFKVARGAAGVTVDQVPLDGKNDATVTLDQVDQEVTFVVASLDAKKADYSYRMQAVGGQEDLLGTAVHLRRLEGLADDAKALTAAADKVEARLARLATDDEAASSALVARFAAATAAEKQELHPILRRVLRQAKYRALDEATGAGDLLAQAAKASATRPDDQDTSHDNLGYLTWKKMELIHGLTHLKIDPVLIEGQILQTWTILELTQGFPHLPIPDGLAIANFKDEQALDILKQWADDFDLDYPFPDSARPAQRPVVPCQDLEKVKRVAQRLIMAEAAIEFCYNNSLVMADDMALCVYDFVRLVLSAKSAAADIAKHFTGVPIVGAVMKALMNKIQGKLVRLIQTFANLISAKLKPPYSTVVPIVVQVLSYAYSKVMHVQLPNETSSSVKELGCKLLAKYALTAIPKVGYVARGQVAVDTAAERAATLKDEGTLAEAALRVLDDGNPATETSLREQVVAQVAARHGVFLTDRKIADVTRKLTTLFQYTSLIDPTSISKVLTVVAGVASTGVLAHAGWKTGQFFFALPRTMAQQGAEGAYGPVAATPERDEVQLLDAPLNGNLIEELLRAAGNSVALQQQLVQRAEQSVRSRDERGFLGTLDQLMTEDDQFDELSLKLEAFVMADGESMRDDAQAEGLYTRSQASALERAAVETDLVAAWCNGKALEGKAADRLARTADLVQHLNARIRELMTRASAHPALLVSKVETKRSWGTVTVTATVANLSGAALEKVTARLSTAAPVRLLDGQERSLGLLRAGEERRVTWQLKPGAADDLDLPVAAVQLDAPGAQPLSAVVALN